MTIKNALASLAVTDVSVSEEWYSRLLRQRPRRPTPELAEWHFEGGGGLQVYELPERAGAGSCTLTVTNLDDHVATVAEMGIEGAEAVANETVTTLMITDPDGNHVAFAESLEAR